MHIEIGRNITLLLYSVDLQFNNNFLEIAIEGKRSIFNIYFIAMSGRVQTQVKFRTSEVE